MTYYEHMGRRGLYLEISTMGKPFDDTRHLREQQSGEVAPAPAASVMSRIDARIAWLEKELANVDAWREELATLKRMQEAAKPKVYTCACMGDCLCP